MWWIPLITAAVSAIQKKQEGDKNREQAEKIAALGKGPSDRLIAIQQQMSGGNQRAAPKASAGIAADAGEFGFDFSGGSKQAAPMMLGNGEFDVDEYNPLDDIYDWWGTSDYGGAM